MIRYTMLLLLFLCVPTLYAKDPDPQRWENIIAKFEKQDQAMPPPAGAVLFTGSSSIALWKDVGKHFPEHAVLNRGFGGSTLPEVNHFLDRVVLKYRPRIVVLFCGGNDMAAYQRPPEQVLADFQTFCKRIHEKLPETRILYLSIHLPPGRLNLAEQTRKANSLIEAHCRGNARLGFVNIYDLMLGTDGKPKPELYQDKLHPSAKAYELWAEKLRPLLK